jgi:hypothetical protein
MRFLPAFMAGVVLLVVTGCTTAPTDDIGQNHI